MKLPRNKFFDHPTRQGRGDQYTVGEIDEDSTRRLLGVPTRGKTNADHPPPTILAFRITAIHIWVFTFYMLPHLTVYSIRSCLRGQ